MKMNQKPCLTVTVIGVGRVGSAVAFALIPHCTRIYLVDSNAKRLEGEFRDLRHSAWLINSGCTVEKGIVDDANRSDYAIICVGKARSSSAESTDDLFEHNYPVVRRICQAINARTLILTNPVEKITEHLNKELKIQAVPIGGLLDEAREQIDKVKGGYIIDHKGHTNWGVAGEVVEFVKEKKHIM